MRPGPAVTRCRRKAVDGVLTGHGRVTVFAMLGTAFGYATHSLDGRGMGEVAWWAR